MFGYVRPMKGELKVKEFEEYKAVYCTLCKALGKHYGLLSRLLLSYDVSFYAMFALDAYGTLPQVKKGRCVVNPMKRCTYICEGDEVYHKAAALNVLMSYYKLEDNIQDEKLIKRLLYRVIKLFFVRAGKKAKKEFPFMAEAIEAYIKAQKAAEESETPSIDECAKPTADVLSKIFAELAGGDKTKEIIFSQFGFYLGRWIYLMDAADDLKDDLKEGKFNPYIYRLKLNGNEIPADRQSECDNYCNEVLNSNVAMMNSALNLLNMGRYENIIKNVTELGFAEVQREILFLHIRSKEYKKLHKGE